MIYIERDISPFMYCSVCLSIPEGMQCQNNIILVSNSMGCLIYIS